MPPQNVYRTTFRENFLSDPSTYPLIVVMTVATGFIVGMSANALTNYKGLRIRPSAKHEVIPTWDAGTRITVTETLTRNPKAFHADAFKAIRREGLGVDHEEWIKAKQSQA